MSFLTRGMFAAAGTIAGAAGIECDVSGKSAGKRSPLRPSSLAGLKR